MTEATGVPLVFAFSNRYRWPLGWIVQLWTCSPFVHVDAVLVAELVGSGPDGGVRARPAAANADRRVKTVTLQVTGDQWLKFWSFVDAQRGKRYDWVGLLGFGTRLRIEAPSKWFCSELLQAGLDEAGIETGSGTSPTFTSPKSLFRRLVAAGGVVA